MTRNERTRLGAWAVALATALALGVSAGRPGPATAAESGMKEKLVTVKAKVKAVDLKHRLVTLKGPMGNTFVVEVGPAVRNLPQVKVGDNVVLSYYEALAFQIKPAGSAKLGVTSTRTV